MFLGYPRKLLIFVACCATVLHTQAALFVADNSITINGSSEEGSQEFENGDTLELFCEAKFQIEWKWPNNSQYIGWSNPVNGRLDVSPLTQSEQGRYMIRLRLTNLNHADTGKYFCHEKGNENRALDHYVFVQDPVDDHIFLHWVDESMRSSYSHLMAFYENRDSYIDCLVTHPDATVKLLIKNEDTQLTGYDPRKGFAIAPHQLAAYSTEYGAISSCEATTPDGRSDSVQFLLLGLTASSRIVINLNDSSAKHSYKGGRLELDCSGSGKQSFTLRCYWTYPAQDEKRSNRINVTKHQESSTAQTISLKVFPLRLSDSGNYTCICDDHGAAGAVNSSWSYISVSPTKGQVTLLAQSTQNQSVITGDRAEFLLRFTVWPAPWDKKWWHKYISPIYGHQNRSLSVSSAGPRMSVMSLATSRFGFADVDPNSPGAILTEQLIVDNVVASDSGQYQIDIMVAGTTFTFNFSLFVQSSQLSSQLQVTRSNDLSKTVDARFLHLGEHYAIICLGTGYPLPHMELHWKPCVKNQACQWTQVTTRGTIMDGTFQRALMRRQEVTESGTYNCIAADGVVRTMTPFSVQAEVIVTDIPDSEENRGMILEKNHQAKGEDGDPRKVYEKDGFSLHCLVQKYDYSQITWYLETVDENNNTVDEFLGDDLQTTPIYNVTYTSQSPYSNKLSLTFASVKEENSGKYLCKAALNPSPVKRRREYVLRVTQLRRPKFASWSSGHNLVANYSGRFQLRCGAIGSPKPGVEWRKDGKPYTARPGISETPDRTNITISRVVAEDTGTYTCTARNRAGFIMKSIKLTVLGVPSNAVLSTTGIVILSVCLGLAAFIVLVLTTFVCILKRRERVKTAQLQDLYDQLMSSAEDAGSGTHFGPKKLDPNKPVNRQAENLPYDRRYELSRSWLRLDKVLGEGQFGRVLSGTLKIPSGEEERYSRMPEPPQAVAVKIPLNGRSLQHQKALLDELKIMIHIGKHVNVLGLIGAVTKHMVKGELYVVVEFCSLGSLMDYLRSHRATFVTEIVPRSPSSPPPRSSISNDGYLQPNHMLGVGHQQLTSYQSEFDGRWSEELNENRLTRSFLSTSDLLSYCYQTANGMDFLASKNLIHRDLAARNLLLTEQQFVKIADFGLARQDQTYHIQGSKNVPLPIKWMALESITHQDFTVKSDMWSFGVVMWEFFSLAETPYPSQPLDPSFVSFLKDGNRLEQPNHSPDEIFHLMRQCWLTNPDDRPSFAEAREVIGTQLRRCSPQLFAHLRDSGEEIYEEANVPSYYNWNIPNYSLTSHGAAKLNLPKRLQGFREIPQDDPDSARLSSSVENRSYMLQDMHPIRSAQSQNTGYINTLPVI